MGYSPAHFSRQFRGEVGLSPGRYLSALRFHAAKRLLLTGSDPGVDVCAAVGFTSLTTFSRRFAQVTGVNPTAFRTLADTLSDTTLHPFALPGDSLERVTVRCHLPGNELRGGWHVWIGWYPHPAPIGLPHSGVLCELSSEVQLPLNPGAPWLMALAVDPHCDPEAVLAPEAPLGSVHRFPLTAAASIDLHFAPQPRTAVPLLSALPHLAFPRTR